MAKFRQDNKSGGSRSFGNRDSGSRGFGGHDRSSRPQMHKAVCDECGESCEVPFRPTGDKPIYCNTCFANKRGSDDNRNGGARNRERPSFGDRADRQMFSATCSACGSKCQVPFEPSGDKPVYCEDCFAKNKRGGSERISSGGKGNDGQLKIQLDALNAKLDKILKILAPNSVAPVVVEKPISKPKEAIAKEIKEPVLKKEIVEEKKESKPEKKVIKKKVAVKKNPSKKLGAGK